MTLFFRLRMSNILRHVRQRKRHLQKPWFSKALPTGYRLLVIHIYWSPEWDYRNYFLGFRREQNQLEVSTHACFLASIRDFDMGILLNPFLVYVFLYLKLLIYFYLSHWKQCWDQYYYALAVYWNKKAYTILTIISS